MIIVQTVPEVPRGGRLIIVGDIHGCPKEFADLLRKTRFRKGLDLVVCVGDYVNKGYDSAGAVKLAMEIGALGVMGNHDMTLIHVIREIQDGVVDPQVITDDPLFRTASTFPAECFEYLCALPHILRVPQFNTIIVHAGLRRDVPFDNQNLWELLHMRRFTPQGRAIDAQNGGKLWAESWNGPELVVFGHDAMSGLQQGNHYYGLDTGCVYGGQLTALILPGRELVQVPGSQIPAEKRKKPAGSVSLPAAKPSPAPEEVTAAPGGFISEPVSTVTLQINSTSTAALKELVGLTQSSPSTSAARPRDVSASATSPAPRPPTMPVPRRDDSTTSTSMVPIAGTAVTGASSSKATAAAASGTSRLRLHIVTRASSLAMDGLVTHACDLLGGDDEAMREDLIRDESISSLAWGSLAANLGRGMRKTGVVTAALHWLQDVALERPDAVVVAPKNRVVEDLGSLKASSVHDEKLLRATLMALR